MRPSSRPLRAPRDSDLDANSVYDLALEVASSLSFDYVGTEVLILALMTAEESASSTLLTQAGVEEPTLRAAILKYLGR